MMRISQVWLLVLALVDANDVSQRQDNENQDKAVGAATIGSCIKSLAVVIPAGLARGAADAETEGLAEPVAKPLFSAVVKKEAMGLGACAATCAATIDWAWNTFHGRRLATIGRRMVGFDEWHGACAGADGHEYDETEMYHDKVRYSLDACAKLCTNMKNCTAFQFDKWGKCATFATPRVTRFDFHSANTHTCFFKSGSVLMKFAERHGACASANGKQTDVSEVHHRSLKKDKEKCAALCQEKKDCVAFQYDYWGNCATFAASGNVVSTDITFTMTKCYFKNSYPLLCNKLDKNHQQKFECVHVPVEIINNTHYCQQCESHKTLPQDWELSEPQSIKGRGRPHERKHEAWGSEEWGPTVCGLVLVAMGLAILSMGRVWRSSHIRKYTRPTVAGIGANMISEDD